MIITVSIPAKGTILIEPGQKVDFTTDFIKIKNHEKIHLSVSQKLNIPSNKIFRYMKKFVGDEIKKGDLIALKQSLFSSQKYLSRQEGTIQEINHQEGTVIVEINTKKDSTIKCFFKGEVIEVNKENIKIKVRNGKQYSLKEATQSTGGEIRLITDQQMNLSEEQLRGKFILINKITSYNQAKAEALGVAGFISSYQIPEKTDLPIAIVKSDEDWKNIIKLEFPYCLIDKENSKIYLYE